MSGSAGGTHSDEATAKLVAAHVADVPDFPQPGILFKDLSPLFADGPAFHEMIDAIVAHYRDASGEPTFDVVVGIEARGFVIAAAVAYATGLGVVPVRKAGKLPRTVHSASYALEYGEATLEVHTDAFAAGQRVLVVDDVLATGGTAEATLGLVERAGGRVAGLCVVLELAFPGGRERLARPNGACSADGLTAPAGSDAEMMAVAGRVDVVPPHIRCPSLHRSRGARAYEGVVVGQRHRSGEFSSVNEEPITPIGDPSAATSRRSSRAGDGRGTPARRMRS